MSQPVRLQKLLAQMGVASRRAGEKLIAEGRVQVNGQVVTTPGLTITSEDEVRVDGRIITVREEHVYIVLNKPRGVLSTARDERGRPTVVDLVARDERLYPVGRLDLDSDGLMLLTNDGGLAQRMTHSRYQVHKQYLATVAGSVTDQQLRQLRAGVRLEDGLSRPLAVEVVERSPSSTRLLLTLAQGRKRQVRRTLQAVGLQTLRLTRVAMGPLMLGDLAEGQIRQLTPEEARNLRMAVGLPPRGE